MLSVHAANWAPDLIWLGAALFYGGLAQFMAGQNSMSSHPVLKVGRPIWSDQPATPEPARIGGGYGQAIPQH